MNFYFCFLKQLCILSSYTLKIIYCLFLSICFWSKILNNVKLLPVHIIVHPCRNQVRNSETRCFWNQWSICISSCLLCIKIKYSWWKGEPKGWINFIWTSIRVHMSMSNRYIISWIETSEQKDWIDKYVYGIRMDMTAVFESE